MIICINVIFMSLLMSVFPFFIIINNGPFLLHHKHTIQSQITMFEKNVKYAES